jgi:hypothetical protein
MAGKKPTVNDFKYLDVCESYVQLSVVLVLFVLILQFSSVFEASYSSRLVELYGFPWWRFLVVCLVLVGSWWCPRIGIVLALAAFFYLNDMHILTNSFIMK